MNYLWEQWLTNDQVRFFVLQALDISLVLVLSYVVLVIIGERRTLWMVRGLIFLMLAAALSKFFGLALLGFVLDKLVIGSAVAMAFMLQGSFADCWSCWARGGYGSCLAPLVRLCPRPIT
jgi:DNA integrity scanning protein DisA with diadenylate cyclase activity